MKMVAVAMTEMVQIVATAIMMTENAKEVLMLW